MSGLIDVATGLRQGSGLAWLLRGLGGGSAALADWVLTAGGTPATLDIDFVNNRAWNSPATPSIASLLTCARATPAAAYYTNADGTLITFAANTLRYGTNGLLVEEARTNLCLQSQTFGNAAWTQNATTVSADSIAAPDGTLTADAIVENTSNAIHRTDQTGITTAAVAYVYSCYAKAIGSRQLFMNADGLMSASAAFNLTGSGSVVGTAGTAPNLAATIVALANGWYRCAVIGTASAATSLVWLQINRSSFNSPGDDTYVGDGVSGLYVWGAQLEAGAFATSYIPTTSGSVTRAADNITFATQSWYNGTDVGTFYAQAASPYEATNTNARIWGADGGKTPISAANNTQLVSFDGSTPTVVTADTGNWTSTAKSAAASNGSTISITMNGTLNTGTAGFGSIATFYLGSDRSSANWFDGYIKEVAYWNTRLSNAGLQTLTT